MNIEMHLKALEAEADVLDLIATVETILAENIDLVRANDQRHGLQIEDLTRTYLKSLQKLSGAYDKGMEALEQAINHMDSCSKNLRDAIAIQNPFKIQS